jgi:hypothetical protein
MYEAHNVRDGRVGWVGSWEIAPLDVTKLTEADIGRTVIYRSHNRAEAGTLTSWRDNIVFARYSRGDTAAGAYASDLVFGLRRIDDHPDAPITPGPDLVCWEHQAGREPIRLSFSIKVF